MIVLTGVNESVGKESIEKRKGGKSEMRVRVRVWLDARISDEESFLARIIVKRIANDNSISGKISMEFRISKD